MIAFFYNEGVRNIHYFVFCGKYNINCRFCKYILFLNDCSIAFQVNISKTGRVSSGGGVWD